MADQNTCDMCGRLIIGDPVRYELKIKLYAGYDVLEIAAQDLEQDLIGKLNDLTRQMEGRDPEEMEREIYEEFSYDLCVSCRDRYRRDPLCRARLLSHDTHDQEG